MTGCGRCDSRWGGEKVCHCAGCHRTFQSLNSFDEHRVGKHADGSRRCMSDEEIADWGFEPNQNGYLRVPMTAAQLEKFMKSKEGK